MNIEDLNGKWFALTDDEGEEIQMYQVIKVVPEQLRLLGRQKTDDGSHRFDERPIERSILWDSYDLARNHIQSLAKKRQSQKYKPEEKRPNAFNLAEALRGLEQRT